MRGWIPAWRLARRDVWRNKGRSLLIGLMIAVPVLVMAAASVVSHSVAWDQETDLAAEIGAQAQAGLDRAEDMPLQQHWDGSDYQLASGAKESERRSELRKTDSVEYTEKLRQLIPAADELHTVRTLTTKGHLHSADGSDLGLNLIELDYADADLDGLLWQVSGRAPESADEVVVGRNLSQGNTVEVGDTLTYQASPDDPEKTLTVVGVVDSYGSRAWNAIIGLPGELLPDAAFTIDHEDKQTYDGAAVTTSWLVTGPDAVTWDQVGDLNAIGARATSRAVYDDPPTDDPVSAGLYSMYDDESSIDVESTAITGVVVGLVLLQIALLAGPAIAVGARRNERTLALMASTGAQRNHLRAVVLLSNGLIGLVFSVVAAALGTGAGALITEGIRRWGEGNRIVGIDVSLVDPLALVIVGAGTATAASLLPARRVARQDVVATLTGRRDRTSRRRGLVQPVLGAIVAVVGLGVAVQATRGFIADELQVVAGLAMFEVGLVMTVGAIVTLAARAAGFLPVSFRFALRDASRQRGRTAPAVAAVLAAVAFGTAGVVYLASAEDNAERSYVGSGAVGVVSMSATGVSTVERYQDGDVPEPDLDRSEAVLSDRLGTDQVEQYQIMRPYQDGEPVTMRIKTSPDNVCEGSQSSFPVTSLESCYWQDQSVDSPFADGIFDDGSAIQVLTGGQATQDAAALRAGQVVVPDPSMLWDDGTVRVKVSRDPSAEGDAKSTTVVSLPAVLASGDLRVDTPVYPVSVAEKLGVELITGGLVAQAPGELTAEQASTLRTALKATGEVSDVEVERGYESTYGLGFLALIVASLLVTLLGTFIAVGLAAADSREDISTLAAVGAGPATRRRIAAAQSGVISGIGAGLGVVSGVVAGYVLIRLNRPAGVQYGESQILNLVLPWPYLLMIGIGLPGLVMLVGFLTARSRMPLIRRVGL